MAKRTVITVGPSKTGGWNVQAQGRLWPPSAADTKAEALRIGIEIAKAHQPSSLRIKGRNGRIQEERTYPRSSDPRRTPG
jgi:uncharacterized protein DUF2188